MLLTVPQAARALGLSRQRVHALVKSGAIRADMVGRDWLISDDALDAFRAGRRKRGRPKGCRDKTKRARKTPKPQSTPGTTQRGQSTGDAGVKTSTD